MSAQRPDKPASLTRAVSTVSNTLGMPGGLVLILLGAGFALSACVTLVLASAYLLDLLLTVSPATEIAQTHQPTPECTSPGLALDGRTFSLQSVGVTPEGTLPAPPEIPDLAYLVTGAGEKQVFLLGAAAFEADATALGGLTQAVYTAENCNVTTYQLAPPQAVLLSGASVASLAQAEMSVFIQTGADGSGFALFGTTVAEQMSPTGTPQPVESKVQAEIGLLEARPSAVGGLIRVKVSIRNFGEQALNLTASDVSLGAAGVDPSAPVSAKPSLPETIQPGQTIEFELIFPLPMQGFGTLRVFTTEFELANFVE